MENDYIQMPNDNRAYISQNGTVTINRPGKMVEEERVDFLKFELIPNGARTPYDICLRYWIVGRWEYITGAVPDDSIDYLCSIAATRFKCRITDEVKEAITSMRLLRRMI